MWRGRSSSTSDCGPNRSPPCGPRRRLSPLSCSLKLEPRRRRRTLRTRAVRGVATQAKSAFESAITFWDKQAGSIDDIADAWELVGEAYGNMGKKRAKDAKAALDKADALRKGKTT